MSTHRPRLLRRRTVVRRLGAFAAAGALTVGGLASIASPAAASEETINNATFTWGISGYAQDGIFGPWTFKSFTGDAQFLEGSVVNSPLNANPQTEYNVAPVPATSFPTSKAGRQANAVKFTGGDGTIDRVTGAADLTWDGSYTVNAYPAQFNAPNEIYSDPALKVNADGSGYLEADFTIGAGTDMSGNPFPAQDFGRLKIATFDAGSLSAKSIRGYRVTPDYQGVEVTPAVGTQTRSCTTEGGATGWWGSWPAGYIAALGSSTAGQSVLAHFYSTGCGGKQDTKPPLPFDVTFPTAQGQVQLSKTVFDNDAEETVTVTGTGFNPNLSAGNTHPPFAGKASGTYVAFGRFQDVWDPAVGAPSSARGLGDPATRTGRSVKWAVPASSFPGSPAQDPNAASYTELKADGSFTATLTIKKSDITAASGNWGIFTYRGGNPAVTEYATYTPITFIDKADATVALDEAAYTGTTDSAIPVGVDVTGTAGTATGKVSLSYDPEGAAPATVVDTATLAAGSAELEVPAQAEATEGTLSVAYEGDNAYLAGASTTSTLDVIELAETTTTASLPSAAVFGVGRTATVTVAGGATAPTGTVTAKIAGETVGTGVLNGSGVASVALDKDITVGNHTVVISYPGDTTHGASTVDKAYNVSKGTAALAGLSITSKSTSTTNGSATVKVSVPTGAPNATGQVTVTFTRTGKTTKVGTASLSGGRATVKLPKLAKGTWKVSYKYLGSSSYKQTATKARGTVTIVK